MKKWSRLILCFAVIAALTGCTKKTAPADTASATAEAETIDIDLTAMSSTIVYSEVFQMMQVPEDYHGKTVKMDGIFSYFYNQQTDVYYFACIIQDAAACCSQGIEFELEGDYTYPDDYPEVGSEIAVVGTFDSYQEGDSTYCTLRNAKFV